MTVVTDNFNRANANPMGAPWATLSAQGDFRIVSNAATPVFVGSGDSGQIYNNPDPLIGADQYSKGALTVNSTNSGAGPGFLVRCNSVTGNTCYRLAVSHAASNNCEVARFLAGAFTSLALFTRAFTDGDEWTFRVSGPASAAFLEVLHLGIVVSSLTDNSSLASGYVGVGHSSSSTSASIDNWEGGDYSTGAAMGWITA